VTPTATVSDVPAASIAAAAGPACYCSRPSPTGENTALGLEVSATVVVTDWLRCAELASTDQ